MSKIVNCHGFSTLQMPSTFPKYVPFTDCIMLNGKILKHGEKNIDKTDKPNCVTCKCNNGNLLCIGCVVHKCKPPLINKSNPNGPCCNSFCVKPTPHYGMQFCLPSPFS